MHLPNKQQAHTYLAEAALINPGQWVPHCEYAAQAAYSIASKIDGLDPDAAYVMGLLHDIGRRVGIIDLSHCYTGYQFMLEEGYPHIARICITHSFINKDTRGAEQNWDGDFKDLETMRAFLTSIEYDDYDRLIQLCDAISVSSGYWLMEKRLLDVGIRRGVSDSSPERWQALLDVKNTFEKRLGFSVYQLLPGVIENTFDFSPNGKDFSHGGN